MPNPTPDTSGLTPGGTSLTGNGVHSPRLAISVPADWKSRLDAIAAERNIGTSKLLRQIIGDWLGDPGHEFEGRPIPPA